VEKLQQALSQTPPERAKDADAVTAHLEELVTEAKKTPPDKEILDIRGKRLKQAAENIRDVIPTVFEIATGIIGRILLLGA
jgi:hypothetical protein